MHTALGLGELREFTTNDCSDCSSSTSKPAVMIWGLGGVLATYDDSTTLAG